jgi:hygromycin-B 7''-O-kinase
MNDPNRGGDDSAVVADAIRRDHALGDGVTRYTTGSVPVFAVGDDHVVKLYPAAERSHFQAEWAALTRIDGGLPVPTPRAVAAGERGSWFYIVMTRLAGIPMVEAWPEIDGKDRLRLVHEVGSAIAALHAVRTDDLEPLAIDWPAFVETQRTSCRDRQLSRGLPTPWADAVEPFLARWTPGDDGARVLLHTEVMREHLLVDRRSGAWHVSGLFDFEPAMIGAPGYEMAAVGLFVSCAEPGLLRAFLDGYGGESNEDLPFRIMAWALLHRYSNLPWYLERLPAPDREGDLEALARRWFTP